MSILMVDEKFLKCGNLFKTKGMIYCFNTEYKLTGADKWYELDGRKVPRDSYLMFLKKQKVPVGYFENRKETARKRNMLAFFSLSLKIKVFLEEDYQTDFLIPC